jgi:Vam6/Vps39-like protein vacuolar protein sorting-associated protein 39
LLGKGLHRQALKLLQTLGQKEEPEADSISITTTSGSENLAGPEHSILYLQKLKGEDIDVILEFARWPLEANEEMAMEVFVAEIKFTQDFY